MRILILTPHFYPETFKCNDMAFELQRRGHSVTVMTAIPDYPQGNFFKGYGIFKRRKDDVNGVKVYRSIVVPRGSGSPLRLSLNYLSYTFFASINSIWMGVTNRYDAIIVHETSPVMVGIPAIIIKKMQNLPVLFWVLDLWPESLSAAGGISNKYILGPFENLIKWIYKNSDKILISSNGFRKSIVKKGDFNNKIVYFPNWVDEIPLSDDNAPKLPSGFNIVFTGNIGDAQDFPHILDAAERLKGLNINFIIIGDGRARQWVENKIREQNLKNVYCFGRYPIEFMKSFYEQADLLFLALKDSPIFSLTVPAKLQAYMAAGKPVVAMINGEGADLIKKADCGWSVPAGDSKALADILTTLSRVDKSVLFERGLNGKKYSQKHFSFKKCIDHLEKYLYDLVKVRD